MLAEFSLFRSPAFVSSQAAALQNTQVDWFTRNLILSSGGQRKNGDSTGRRYANATRLAKRRARVALGSGPESLTRRRCCQKPFQVQTSPQPASQSILNLVNEIQERTDGQTYETLQTILYPQNVKALTHAGPEKAKLGPYTEFEVLWRAAAPNFPRPVYGPSKTNAADADLAAAQAEQKKKTVIGKIVERAALVNPNNGLDSGSGHKSSTQVLEADYILLVCLRREDSSYLTRSHDMGDSDSIIPGPRVLPTSGEAPGQSVLPASSFAHRGEAFMYFVRGKRVLASFLPYASAHPLLAT
ncbi:hypothetical protein R3P38DRAFT_3367378 [Favolaschia claudopus]|uniref:Uncharacterized protein n=1 Tax=Favolaschia claudopus TaxID=2862362 RepID=A0AAW0AB08_9AGAR